MTRKRNGGRGPKVYPVQDIRKTATLIKRELRRKLGKTKGVSMTEFLRARYRVANKIRNNPEAFRPIMSTHHVIIKELRSRVET